MTDGAEERLRRLLGGNHLASLRKRLRRRFERAPLNGLVESFRVSDLTAPEHAALASLLGRPQRYANSLRIDVRQVDAAFRLAWPPSSDQIRGCVPSQLMSRAGSRSMPR